MMRLKKFEVRNYKNFKDTFVMDFSNVQNYTFNQSCIRDGLIKNAIIYGKNAVGKSNFGRAFMDITNHLVDKMKDYFAPVFYINVDTETDHAWFCYTICDEKDEIRYEYEKSNVTTLLSEALYVNNDLVFSYNYIAAYGNFNNLSDFGLSTLNWKFHDSSMSILRYMANNLTLEANHPIIKFMNFVNNMLWFRGLGSQSEYIGFLSRTENMIDYLIENDYVNSFEDFLKNHDVNEQIIALKDANGQKSIYFKHEQAFLPFTAVASNGTNVLLTFYYWYTQMKKASFVFIDEFDAFYHFDLAEQIINLAKEELDMQVIFTSHNTNLLSNRFLRPDCCFILTKERLTSFVDATDRELKEGHDLEMLYMSGEFND